MDCNSENAGASFLEILVQESSPCMGKIIELGRLGVLPDSVISSQTGFSAINCEFRHIESNTNPILRLCAEVRSRSCE